MICRMICPVGLMGITIVYAGFVVALQLMVPECLEESCDSEGIDNFVVAWATDFFVSTAMFGFGLHLAWVKDLIRRSGILAQIFMAGSFALVGISRTMYTNNEYDDGKGLLGYWSVFGVASIFFTLSAFAHGQFAKEAFRSTAAATSVDHNPRNSITVLGFLQGSMILICVGNLVGCIWCASLPELRAGGAIAELEDSTPTCITIVDVTEVLLWFAYILQWIPAGFLLHEAAIEKPKFVWGLETPAAAIIIFVLQWSAGGLFFVCLNIIAWVSKIGFLNLYHQWYGPQISHFAMLITFFCAHNLTWTLTMTIPERFWQNKRQTTPTSELLNSKKDENANKGPNEVMSTDPAMAPAETIKKSILEQPNNVTAAESDTSRSNAAKSKLASDVARAQLVKNNEKKMIRLYQSQYSKSEQAQNRTTPKKTLGVLSACDVLGAQEKIEINPALSSSSKSKKMDQLEIKDNDFTLRVRKPYKFLEEFEQDEVEAQHFDFDDKPYNDDEIGVESPSKLLAVVEEAHEDIHRKRAKSERSLSNTVSLTDNANDDCRKGYFLPCGGIV